MDKIQHELTQIINGKRYTTKTAMLLAESYGTGTGTHLYKSLKGNYFIGYSTIWENCHSSIEPVTTTDAKEVYEGMRPVVSYETAFGVAPEEA